MELQGKDGALHEELPESEKFKFQRGESSILNENKYHRRFKIRRVFENSLTNFGLQRNVFS